MSSHSFRWYPSVAVLVGAAVLSACGSRKPQAAPTPSDSVAVGYGMQARRDVTGAISSVDGEAVTKNGSARTIADMLDGRVAGLEVRRLGNGGVSIRIRGARSFKASDEPLYVVDGLALASSRGEFPDLSPYDIKSIEVLKDAGSLAAFGSRGANGVILITTRK